MSYTSPTAHSKRDVLGTWQRGVLAGHNRYAHITSHHITALRDDAVSSQILRMEKIISEDALRRSLSRINAEQSRALYTYWILNLRLVLDVIASPGNEHNAAKARLGVIGALEKFTPQQRPALTPGDCGFGNKPFIAELKDRSQRYLFKLRQPVGVKKLWARQFARVQLVIMVLPGRRTGRAHGGHHESRYCSPVWAKQSSMLDKPR